MCKIHICQKITNVNVEHDIKTSFNCVCMAVLSEMLMPSGFNGFNLCQFLLWSFLQKYVEKKFGTYIKCRKIYVFSTNICGKI